MTIRSNLPELPSYSLAQAAVRLELEESEVVDCIKTGVLIAHLFLSHVPVHYRNPAEPTETHETVLNGYFRLPNESAILLLDRWNGVVRPDWRSDIRSFALVLREPDFVVAVLGVRARAAFEIFKFEDCVFPGDMRVLGEEVERFRGASGVDGDAAGKLRNSQRHKELCRGAAMVVWKMDPTLGISELIQHSPEFAAVLDAIEKEAAATNGVKNAYTFATLRDWIHDLCPNPRPGPRPKAKA